MRLRSISGAGELRGKTVLLRVDFNGATEGSETKLERALTTLRMLVHRGAKVVLMTHLGRPDGRVVPSLSTRTLASHLAKLVGMKIKYAGDVVGPKAKAAVLKLKNREILMLENLRFEKGEEKNDTKFAKALASLGDLYVNDAFAVSHRAHASVLGITKHLDSYAGIGLSQEVQHQMHVLEERPRGLVVVMGGAKVSSKIDVLERFLKQGSLVLVGGAMANAFFKARGFEVGKSLAASEEVKAAAKLVRYKNLVLPIDVVVAKRLADKAPLRMVPPTAIESDEIIVDVGLSTLCEYRAILDRVSTIVWNGPMGIYEIPSFAHGSIMLARTVAARTQFGAFSVVGGGETLEVAHMSGMEQAFSYVSTGGGAMLEFLSGRMLPGLIPLVEK
ncbi:MAG: phosphoglycerate kinase [bacterium]